MWEVTKMHSTNWSIFSLPKSSMRRAIQTPEVLVLCANNQAIDSSFIYYLLRCNIFFNYIMKEVKGIKMPEAKRAYRKVRVAFAFIEGAAKIIQDVC